MKRIRARWLLVAGLVVAGVAAGLMTLGVEIGIRLGGAPPSRQAVAVTDTPSPEPTTAPTATPTTQPTSAPPSPTPPPKARFTLIEADWPNEGSRSCIYQPWACIVHGTFRNDGSGLGNAPVKFSGPPYGASCMTVIPLTRPGDVAEASCVINSSDLGSFMAFHSSDQIPAPGVEISNP